MSTEVYELMWKNFVVGEVERSVRQHIFHNQGKAVNVNLPVYGYTPFINLNKKVEGKQYPWGLYPLKVEGTKLVTDTNVEPESAIVEAWLGTRIFPADRENAEEILDAIGLKEYNVWEINKYTHSFTLEDYYWIRLDKSEVYEEIHPRHLAETGNIKRLEELKMLGILPI